MVGNVYLKYHKLVTNYCIHLLSTVIMKKKDIIFSAVLLFSFLLVSCHKNTIYDDMPAGSHLSVAYNKLLKKNKLERDSTASFVDIGANFVIYPDNKVEQNQASVYIVFSQKEKGVFKYIYNMTTDKFDSYEVNWNDSLGSLFPHQLFPSFESLDAIRDSLLREVGISNPQIANIRFYINPALNRPEIETIVEDTDNPANSKVVVSAIK